MLVRRHLSTIAIAFVTAAVTAGAPALATAIDAMNADKVDDRHAVGSGASVDVRKGKLVATSGTTGRLPNDIIAKAPDADRLDGLSAAAFSRPLKRTVVVDAAGTAAENGAALRNALLNIPTGGGGPAYGNEWLVILAPGKYALGGDPLQMRDHVDIEGAGADATTIQCNCGSTVDPAVGATVRGATNADLQSLMVRNDSGADRYAAAYLQPVGTTGELTEVTLFGYGEQGYGAFVDNSATLRIDDSWITAASLETGDSTAVQSDNGSIRIHDSRLDGADSIRNLFSANHVRVANTRLTGGIEGAAVCFSSYNTGYGPVAPDCTI